MWRLLVWIQALQEFIQQIPWILHLRQSAGLPAVERRLLHLQRVGENPQHTRQGIPPGEREEAGRWAEEVHSGLGAPTDASGWLARAAKPGRTTRLINTMYLWHKRVLELHERLLGISSHYLSWTDALLFCSRSGFPRKSEILINLNMELIKRTLKHLTTLVKNKYTKMHLRCFYFMLSILQILYKNTLLNRYT